MILQLPIPLPSSLVEPEPGVDDLEVIRDAMADALLAPLENGRQVKNDGPTMATDGLPSLWFLWMNIV